MNEAHPFTSALPSAHVLHGATLVEVHTHIMETFEAGAALAQCRRDARADSDALDEALRSAATMLGSGLAAPWTVSLSGEWASALDGYYVQARKKRRGDTSDAHASPPYDERILLDKRPSGPIASPSLDLINRVKVELRSEKGAYKRFIDVLSEYRKKSIQLRTLILVLFHIFGAERRKLLEDVISVISPSATFPELPMPRDAASDEAAHILSSFDLNGAHAVAVNSLSRMRPPAIITAPVGVVFKNRAAAIAAARRSHGPASAPLERVKEDSDLPPPAARPARRPSVSTSNAPSERDASLTPTTLYNTRNVATRRGSAVPPKPIATRRAAGAEARAVPTPPARRGRPIHKTTSVLAAVSAAAAVVAAKAKEKTLEEKVADLKRNRASSSPKNAESAKTEIAESAQRGRPSPRKRVLTTEPDPETPTEGVDADEEEAPPMTKKCLNSLTYVIKALRNHNSGFFFAHQLAAIAAKLESNGYSSPVHFRAEFEAKITTPTTAAGSIKAAAAEKLRTYFSNEWAHFFPNLLTAGRRGARGAGTDRRHSLGGSAVKRAKLL